jgi:hypothetical protein
MTHSAFTRPHPTRRSVLSAALGSRASQSGALQLIAVC